VVICLERGADCLHMVQLMPLHPKAPSSLAVAVAVVVSHCCTAGVREMVSERKQLHMTAIAHTKPATRAVCTLVDPSQHGRKVEST